MRRRIFWGTAAVAGFTLVVGLAVVAAVQRTADDRLAQELFAQAEATARLIEGEVGPRGGGLSGRGAEIVTTVRRVGGHDYVEVAAITPGGIRPLVPDPVVIPRLALGVTDRQVVEVDVDGTPVTVAVRRLDLDTAAPVIVAIGREGTRLTRVLALPLLVALAVGALLAAGLAGLLARTTARRLDRLAEAAGRIAGGDLGERARIDGDDEVALVGRAFDAMAGDLEEAQRREREFLMSVGHDLRTPLTTIRGYAEALQSGAVAPDDLPRVAGVLHAQADRLSRLVEDLMLLARLEAREFTLRPEPVDLSAHLGEVVEAHRSRAAAAGVDLRSELGDVGQVVVDPDRIAQVASNLIDNALRYTPEAGSVTVRLAPGTGGCVLEVADTGPGIDPSDEDRVFERLYVAGRYRPVRPEGSGLGLSIVKELADAMGMGVAVAPTPGGGTTFRVDLPERA